MLTHTANHTITLHDDFAVIVPDPESELTSECLHVIQKELEKHTTHIYPILFYPHSKYSIKACAMKEIIQLSGKFRLAIISGSDRTRLVYDFFTDFCTGVEIFDTTDKANVWLNEQLNARPT